MKHLITLLLVILTLNGYSQSKTEDTLSYYEEVCLNREWQGKLEAPVRFINDIKIYVSGRNDDTLLLELDKIVEELNWLISDINIYIVDEEKNSNITIYLGGMKDYLKQLNCDKSQLKKRKFRLENNWGMFWVTHYNGVIENSEIFIDVERTSTDEERKHLLREELTQSMGLFNDSNKYPKSIFYSSWVEDTTEYTDIDKAIIKLLYSIN